MSWDILGHDTTTEMAPNWGFFPLHVLLMEMKVTLKSQKEIRVCSSPAKSWWAGGESAACLSALVTEMCCRDVFGLSVLGLAGSEGLSTAPELGQPSSHQDLAVLLCKVLSAHLSIACPKAWVALLPCFHVACNKLIFRLKSGWMTSVRAANSHH